MNRFRRTAVLLFVAGLGVLSSPALAQTNTGEFNYSPEAQERGQSITITGKCIFGGSTSNVDMIVTVQEGSGGEGNYGFSKAFLPSENGTISGTIEVPGDAPYGAYVIGGACRSGGTQQFFSKNGPFSVVVNAATATTAPAARPTTTTSTTVIGATTTTSTSSNTVAGATTTTAPDDTELPTTVDDSDDTTSTTETTIDEFAGTRGGDDDSIGPLLLLIGIVPLALAAGAIALALRRSRRVTVVDG